MQGQKMSYTKRDDARADEAKRTHDGTYTQNGMKQRTERQVQINQRGQHARGTNESMNHGSHRVVGGHRKTASMGNE